MLIGLTYDLRQDYLARGFEPEAVAEFDSPETIAAIEAALTRLGHQPRRVGGLPELMAALLAGQRWDLVFNIAEGLGGFGREAQVPAVLDYHGQAYVFSDPLTLSLTLHKAMAKRVVRDLGLATPDFAVIDDVAQLAEVSLAYPLFAKPVAEGTGRGVEAAGKVGDAAALAAVCQRLLARYGQPVLVERFLPGREFTVGVLGTGSAARAVAVMEVILLARAEAEVYSYHNKENCEGLVRYELADGPLAQACAALAVAAHRGLGCRDASRVDLRCDETGRPHFMEINPLAGLCPGHSDLPILCGLAGMGYDELIEAIVASALARRATVAA